MLTKNTALLLIDVQQGFDEPMWGQRNNPDAEEYIAEANGFTPTPLISFAILAHNRKKTEKADGIVITPSHTPPEDGGFKYNPPHGGPADSDATTWVADRANELLRDGNAGVKRIGIDGGGTGTPHHIALQQQ